MYSSIMKTKTRPGDYLAIIGAGGGLGHMYVHTMHKAMKILLSNNSSCRGIQIAVKKGLKVVAIDRYALRQAEIALCISD